MPSVQKLAAAGVHVFTALGAVAGLLAALAVVRHDWVAVFAWLGIALIIDGADGPLARRIDITTRLPDFSGERLDWIIDYVTYVFVPVLALLEAGYLTGQIGLILGSIVAVVSLYHFCDMANKSDDGCFVGFPAIWNIFAFYIFVFDCSTTVTAIAILICSVLTFVPLKWVHPVRARWLRPVTGAVTILWAVVAALALYNGFPFAYWSQIVLGAVGLYGIGVSLAFGMAR